MIIRVSTLVFALLLAVTSAHAATDAEAEVGLKAGQKAPRFKLPVVNSFKDTATKWGPKKFEDKKIILMSFFATYCEPCKKEMPELVRLHEKYKDDGLGVMLVSIDESDKAGEVVTLAEENNVTFPVVHDRFQVVAKRYDAKKLPYLLMVTPKRDIKSVHVGYDEKVQSGLENEVRKALGMKKLRKKKKKKRRKRRSKKSRR